MNNFENEIRKGLSENGSYDPAMGKALRKQSTESFNRRLLWVELTAMAFVVGLLTVALFELQLFLAASDIKMMILFAIVFLLVTEAINLMKLWYWVVNVKLNVLRELKQLRLELRELSTAVGAPVESMAVDVEEADRVLGQGIPNWGRWLYKVALAVVLVFFFVSPKGVIQNLLMAVSPAAFIAEQTDEWYPAFADQVVVQSDIVLKKWPEVPTEIPITLPYATATVLSASLDGEPIAITEKGAGRYSLSWSEATFSRGKRELEVVWSFPFEDLETYEKGWRARLRSLLPSKSYRLNVVLEEGSGLEARDEVDGARFTPFRGGGDPKVEYGSCGLMVRKREE